MVIDAAANVPPSLQRALRLASHRRRTISSYVTSAVVAGVEKVAIAAVEIYVAAPIVSIAVTAVERTVGSALDVSVQSV